MNIYLLYSMWIAFASWVVGWLVNMVLLKFDFYKEIPNFNFIRSKPINKRIGLGYFKWIVKNTFFKFFNQKIKLKSKSTDLTKIHHEMTIAEIVHIIGFSLVMVVTIYEVIIQNFLFAITIMVMNIVMNLYPILLQQENKRRIGRIIKIETVNRNSKQVNVTEPKH